MPKRFPVTKQPLRVLGLPQQALHESRSGLSGCATFGFVAFLFLGAALAVRALNDLAPSGASISFAHPFSSNQDTMSK